MDFSLQHLRVQLLCRSNDKLDNSIGQCSHIYEARSNDSLQKIKFHSRKR